MFRRTAMTVLLCTASPVFAQGKPQCAVRYATGFVNRLADLPDVIREDILKNGAIADPDEPFEAYDNIMDPSLPTRRLVLAGHSGAKWFVWIDHGGFARHHDVIGFGQIASKRDMFTWY